MTGFGMGLVVGQMMGDDGHHESKQPQQPVAILTFIQTQDHRAIVPIYRINVIHDGDNGYALIADTGKGEMIVAKFRTEERAIREIENIRANIVNYSNFRVTFIAPDDPEKNNRRGR